MTYLSLRHFFPLVFNKTMTPLFAELNFLIHQRYKSSFNLTTFLYLEFLHTNRFLFTSLGKDNPKGLSFANTILFDYSEYLFSNSLVRFFIFHNAFSFLYFPVRENKFKHNTHQSTCTKQHIQCKEHPYDYYTFRHYKIPVNILYKSIYRITKNIVHPNKTDPVPLTKGIIK